MMIYLLITNMGTLLSLRQLKEQWKTILISLAGILGIIVALFTIGTLLFDLKQLSWRFHHWLGVLYLP